MISQQIEAACYSGSTFPSSSSLKKGFIDFHDLMVDSTICSQFPTGNVRGSSPAEIFIRQIIIFPGKFKFRFNRRLIIYSRLPTPPINPSHRFRSTCFLSAIDKVSPATEKKLKLKISKNVNLCFQKLAFTCRASD